MLERWNMFGSFGTPELLIILFVVLLVFGVGRISKLGSELGRGVRAFREGIRDEQEQQDKVQEEEDTK